MVNRTAPELSSEAVQVLEALNPWWKDGKVRPEPPAFRRPSIAELSRRLAAPKGLIEVVIGPRQVGKTTGMHQVIQDLLLAGAAPCLMLLVRFDLEVLREEPASLRSILAWYAERIRQRPLRDGAPSWLFLDEIHKLRRWSDEVKHVGDTYPLRILVTGSSSVLVARGGRESLAGRIFTTQLPTFSVREVIECWQPRVAATLPPAISMDAAFEGGLEASNEALQQLVPQQKLSIRRSLERYYNRGGYRRLYSGEVDDDRWADYLSQTIFENVLGADIPDIFPVESPALLRHIYLAVARLTGQEIAQNKLAGDLTASGVPATQSTVGKYLHYLGDAQLVREFRRYPLAKKASARVPAKITLTDLGVRNAIFRGAPSLWESDPQVLGPLVETLVQSVIRGNNLQVHFYRDFEVPSNRRSSIREVDFVAERLDGTVLPIEVKFRRRIDPTDYAGLLHFMARFRVKRGVLVSREASGWDPENRILTVPLQNFLLAF